MSATDWAAWVQAVGSIVAVAGAAFIAVWQQHKSKQIHNEQRERKNAAAKALLPLTLLELGEYTKDSISGLNKIRAAKGTGVNLVFALPTLPADAIKELKDCIEFADRGPQKRLLKFIEKIQILHSRMARIRDNNGIAPEYELIWRIVDTLDIYARIDILFPYARNQNPNDPGEPMKTHLRSAASICGFIDDSVIVEAIDKHYK